MSDAMPVLDAVGMVAVPQAVEARCRIETRAAERAHGMTGTRRPRVES